MKTRIKRKVKKNSHWVAKFLYSLGKAPHATSDISEALSLGYGDCDDYGFWRFPLYLENEKQGEMK